MKFALVVVITFVTPSCYEGTDLVNKDRCFEDGRYVCGRSLTYNCPVRSGEVDYRQFNPCNDGLKINTITSLAFLTKGKNDAHILLQNNANDFDNNVVEIVIGGWGNTKSVIRNKQQGPPLCSYEGNILSSSSFQWFWVSWNGGCVKVGKGSTVGGSQIMQWCGLNYNINGIRFSYGYGSGGTFIIPFSTHSSPHHDSSKTSDTMSHSHFGTSKSSHNGRSLTYNCPVRSGGVDYRQFNPCNDGLKINTITSLAFQTKGNNDAHILLQNNANDFDNKVVEIVIGGWSNTKSVIRNQQQGPLLCSYEGNILSGSSFRWFWVSWSSGCVKVGKGSTVGGSQIMQWCGLNYNINGIRFSYGYGSGGTFIIPLSTHSSSHHSSSHHSSSHHDTSKSSKASGTSEHSHSSSTKSRKYVTIDCDSWNFAYQVCNVPGAKSINNVRLTEQRSKSECKLNSSFGFDGDHIWVNKGCRGRFNVCYHS